jgi:transcription elongation factor Elf1
MFTTTSTRYTCPTCGKHAVEVTPAGTATVTVSRCEQAPAWVVSSTAPAAIARTWAQRR